jgi:hypothetical protein
MCATFHAHYEIYRVCKVGCRKSVTAVLSAVSVGWHTMRSTAPSASIPSNPTHTPSSSWEPQEPLPTNSTLKHVPFTLTWVQPTTAHSFSSSCSLVVVTSRTCANGCENEVLTAVDMELIVSWDVTPRSLARRYRHFEGTWSLRLLLYRHYHLLDCNNVLYGTSRISSVFQGNKCLRLHCQRVSQERRWWLAKTCKDGSIMFLQNTDTILLDYIREVSNVCMSLFIHQAYSQLKQLLIWTRCRVFCLCSLGCVP